MRRRKLIKSAAGLTFGAIMTGLYTYRIEPYWLQFITVDMHISGLPQHLKGKILMQISDIHVGNRFDYNFIIRSFEKAKNYQPDIVVYTGDYISYESEEQIRQLQEVMSHTVTGKLATVGILGNHDYGINWNQQAVADQVTDTLEEYGVSVLNNQSIDINGLSIAGLDDYWGPNFSPLQVLSELATDSPKVVLCHNPDVCDLDIWGSYKGWILSGHTHGGQCKPPFLKPPMLPVKNKAYSHGHIPLSEDRHLYINRALGCLWPVRFNMRPEITVFRLV